VHFLLTLIERVVAYLKQYGFAYLGFLYSVSKLRCSKQAISFSFDWNLEQWGSLTAREKRNTNLVNNKGMLIHRRRWIWSWESHQTRPTLAFPKRLHVPSSWASRAGLLMVARLSQQCRCQGQSLTMS